MLQLCAKNSRRKAQIGAENHAVTVLCRIDLGSEACRDLLHYAPERVVAFHSRTAGGLGLAIRGILPKVHGQQQAFQNSDNAAPLNVRKFSFLEVSPFKSGSGIPRLLMLDLDEFPGMR